MAPNTLLPDDWSQAAVEAIARHGVDALSVERLATDLGVTKGSFYWHFADRAALVRAAAELWERRATTEVISDLATLDGPRQRLRQLLRLSLTDSVNGPPDVALATKAADPTLGPIVARVTRTRVAYLESLLVDLGLDRTTAGQRARLTYAAYLGHFSLRQALVDDAYLSAGSQDYLDGMVRLISS